MYLELVDMKEERERLEFAQSLLGRFYNVQGLLFSVYCVYKIFMVRECLCVCLCLCGMHTQCSLFLPSDLRHGGAWS